MKLLNFEISSDLNVCVPVTRIVGIESVDGFVYIYFEPLLRNQHSHTNYTSTVKLTCSGWERSVVNGIINLLATDVPGDNVMDMVPGKEVLMRVTAITYESGVV